MIELKDVHKSYAMGDTTVYALRGVSLKIEAGEFVAITGPSGSGKSTLMHVIGLLDVPESGSYQLLGREVAHLEEDELAVLRREAIGFVFQQFNLLPRTAANENVAMPLIYSSHGLNLERADTLLSQVGLKDRVHHKTNELSGGQQQRVAIARALVNRPRIILADEPTGNLDTSSQQEILALLRQLNQQGITIIMVTHEEEVAREARRRISIRDGVVQSDERITLEPVAPETPATTPPPQRWWFNEFGEHLRQGLRSLTANKVRTLLSMLGILIGVAAVVAMMALGAGAQKSIEEQLASLGSNMLMLRPGAVNIGGVSQQAGATSRLTAEDAAAVRQHVPGVKDVASNVTGRARVTAGNKNWNTLVRGTTPEYARMRASEPQAGRFFTEDETQRRARVAVLGLTVVRELFGDQNPLGEMIKLNKVNFQIIGVLPPKGATGYQDQDDVVVIPLNTAMYRLLGKGFVDYIDIEAATPEDLQPVTDAVLSLMNIRHKVPVPQQQDAYQIRNLADIQSAFAQSSRTMSLLLAVIAAISLLVGGIGIMNIMLVSVTERTREVGLRKAVGARRRDILMQFLVEAVVVSVAGGLAGIVLGWLITVVLAHFADWSTSVSLSSVLLAFVFSAGIGITFGIYPARKAARLNPIQALRYE